MTRMISKEEMDRRREAFRRANASVKIEGGRISEDSLTMQDRFIRGEISWKDYCVHVDAITEKNDTGCA